MVCIKGEGTVITGRRDYGYFWIPFQIAAFVAPLQEGDPSEQREKRPQ